MRSPSRFGIALLLSAALGAITPVTASAFTPAGLVAPAFIHFGAPAELGLGANGGVVGASAPDGSVIGFIGQADNPEDDYPITTYQSTPTAAGWTGTAWAKTPFSGKLVATAYDAATRRSYVLFESRTHLWLGGWNWQSGKAEPAATPITSRYHGRGADVVVHSGRVLVVWSEPLTFGSQTTDQLFALDNATRTGVPVRLTAMGTDNSEPDLTTSPDGSVIEAAWTQRAPHQLGTSIGLGADTGRGWTLSTYPTGGLRNDHPSVAFDGTTTYLAWLRDGQVVEADARHRDAFSFGSSTSRPFVAVSASAVDLAYTAVGPDGPVGELAEVLAIGWTSAPLPDPDSAVYDVFSAHGKARVLVHQELHDYALVAEQ